MPDFIPSSAPRKLLSPLIYAALYKCPCISPHRLQTTVPVPEEFVSLHILTYRKSLRSRVTPGLHLDVLREEFPTVSFPDALFPPEYPRDANVEPDKSDSISDDVT